MIIKVTPFLIKNEIQLYSPHQTSAHSFVSVPAGSQSTPRQGCGGPVSPGHSRNTREDCLPTAAGHLNSNIGKMFKKHCFFFFFFNLRNHYYLIYFICLQLPRIHRLALIIMELLPVL